MHFGACCGTQFESRVFSLCTDGGGWAPLDLELVQFIVLYSAHELFLSLFFFFSFSFLLSFAQEPIRPLSRSHTQNLFLSDLARSQSKSLFRQVGVCSQRCRISSEWLTGHIFSVYGSDCFVFFGLKKIQKIHHTWFWNSHKSSCVLSMLCTNLLISLAICSLLWSISYQEIRTMELCHLCLWCLLFELTDRWLWMQPRLQGILQEHVISISK